MCQWISPWPDKWPQWQLCFECRAYRTPTLDFVLVRRNGRWDLNKPGYLLTLETSNHFEELYNLWLTNKITMEP